MKFYSKPIPLQENIQRDKPLSKMLYLKERD
jgi:hypothetical protein